MDEDPSEEMKIEIQNNYDDDWMIQHKKEEMKEET